MIPALFTLFLFLFALPSLALAQGYQHVSDGLVTVQATKVVGEDGRISFDVCAHLTRPESVGPVEIHVNFWGASGGILAQTTPRLHPTAAAPTCQRILLPPRARDFRRWEISRLRFRPAPATPPPDRFTRAG
jgi:hypothetical protein